MKRVTIASLLGAVLLASCGQRRISGVLEVPGAIFRYTAEGHGIPCVAFTGSENLGHVLYTDNLRAHVTIISADPTPIPPDRVKRLTLDSILDDIERLRVWLGLEKIAVMGHSMFGPLPLEYALKYPEHVLLSISTGALPYTTANAFQASDRYWTSEASAERKAVRAANHQALAARDRSMESESDRFWDRYQADVPFRFFDLRFDVRPFRQGPPINLDFVNHFWGVLMRDFDHTAQYSKIRTPVLVVAGKYDFGAPHFLWDDLKGTIPDFTLHLFENAGHNPMIEVPAEFDRVLIEWAESRK